MFDSLNLSSVNASNLNQSRSFLSLSKEGFFSPIVVQIMLLLLGRGYLQLTVYSKKKKNR